MHHEQRRELAHWAGIELLDFYGPSEALAKLYRKAELIDLIDADHKSTGWSPSLQSRGVGELRSMFMEGAGAAPADLERIWSSPIANIRDGRDEFDSGDDIPCRFCGCSHFDPCELDNGPCGWLVAPAWTGDGEAIAGVCTNPECVARFENARGSREDRNP